MCIDGEVADGCFMENSSVISHIVDELAEAHLFAAALWVLWDDCRPNVETCNWMPLTPVGYV